MSSSPAVYGMGGGDTEVLGRLKARFQSLAQLSSTMRMLVLDIEDSLNAQINTIIEHEKFQTLEARWMGLASVVWAKDYATNVKVKVLDLSWQELEHDLNYTSEIRKSLLFCLCHITILLVYRTFLQFSALYAELTTLPHLLFFATFL